MKNSTARYAIAAIVRHGCIVSPLIHAAERPQGASALRGLVVAPIERTKRQQFLTRNFPALFE
ncbi:MAG: hypothetical protein ACREYE_15205 [Gammaproteobacteria bacterium]